MNVRIAPRLDIKGPNLVKGIHFEGLRVLGKPEDFARYYYENGADELIYMDAVASLYGRNSLLEIIERTSREIFIPLTVGGGLRTIEDIRKVLRAGADKVSLNTAAIARPEFVHEASRTFGASTIVVSIEAMPVANGRYEAYVNYGRDRTSVDALEWAVQAADLGAGEIMITSIAREGTGQGFDVELVRKVSDQVSVPVIAGGGAGSVDDVRRVITEGRVEAVALASILHYNYLKQAQQVAGGDYATEGNTEFLKRGTGFSRVKDASPRDVKSHLAANSIACRYSEDAGTHV